MVMNVGTAAQNAILVARMIAQQQQVNIDQTQVATGLKSQDFTGIASDAFGLLNVENQQSRINSYLTNNGLTTTMLNAQQTAVEGITTVAQNMQSLLLQFSGRDLSSKSPQDVSDVQDLQQKAFAALGQIQYFLNQQINGQYVFGGAMSNTPPMSLPYDTLSSFQQSYDGIGTVFPSTAAADNVKLSFDNIAATYNNVTVPPSGANAASMTEVTNQPGTFITQTIDQNATGNLIFSNVGSNGEITAATPGAFKSLQVGQTIMVNNSAVAQGAATGTDNNGIYTITAVSPDGNSITLDQNVNAGTELAADNVSLGVTVPNGTALGLTGSTAGNNGAYTVKWPSNADLAAAGYNLNGSPPDLVGGASIFTSKQIPVTSASGETISLDSTPFLQGVSLPTSQKISDTQTITLGVTGLDPAFEKLIRGLGQIAQGDLIDNPGRVQTALAAINDSVQHSPLESTEAPSDLTQVADSITNNLAAIQTANDTQTSFKSFLEGRQNDLLQADSTQAAVQLQVDSQALEVSYASLAKITQLSLLNYL